MELKNYPSPIIKLLKQIEKKPVQAEEHKLLLDLAETILLYLTSILFGEYKRYWPISKNFETELYRSASKKLSFGGILFFFIHLVKLKEKSVLESQLSRDISETSMPKFVALYETLKDQVINKGIDDNFNEALAKLDISSSVKTPTIQNFFENVVNMRNNYAHPADKAKNPVRAWPLGDEYFAVLNPVLKDALFELLEAVSVFQDHKKIFVLEKNEELLQIFAEVEEDNKIKKMPVQLIKEDFEHVSEGMYHLLAVPEKIHCRLYENEIPDVDSSIAADIIKTEKAKMMEPVLRDMIAQKLEDNVIDELEYMVLKDTANSSYITEERLKTLIDTIGKEKGLTGPILVEKSEKKIDAHFNPYWLVHFGTISSNKVEQSNDPYLLTNRHRNLWLEVNKYLQSLIETELNNEIVNWDFAVNQYQIGALSYTYWGQIFPASGVFKNIFSIGFAIFRQFKWATSTKGTLEHSRLNAPGLIIWPTMKDTELEKLESVMPGWTNKYTQLQKRYLEENYEKFVELNVNIADAKDAKVALIPAAKFKELNPDVGIRLYSPIYNLDDFLTDSVVDMEKVAAINTQIKVFLRLFANILLEINEYGLSKGLNKEKVQQLLTSANIKQSFFKNYKASQ